MLFNDNNLDEILPFEAVKQAAIEAKAELADSDRVLLRKSGTEPLIHVLVE